MHIKVIQAELFFPKYSTVIDIHNTGNFTYQPTHLKNCHAKIKSNVMTVQERNIDNVTDLCIVFLFKKYLHST